MLTKFSKINIIVSFTSILLPGILNLASSVVVLMHRFFSDSFDHLKRDQGLFEGPQPVLLESCSFCDLALLLRGNKRKTSEIEFGAHQVSTES